MDLKVPGASRVTGDDGGEQVEGGGCIDIVITHVYHTMHNTPSIAHICQRFISFKANKSVVIYISFLPHQCGAPS